MGLCCSHGAWNRSYGGFLGFRSAICYALGGSFPEIYQSRNGKWDYYCRFPHPTDDRPMCWWWGVDHKSYPGLRRLMTHSDANGWLHPATCRRIAAELPPLVPKMQEFARLYWPAWDFAALADQFIAGCQRAADANERMTFG